MHQHLVILYRRAPFDCEVSRTHTAPLIELKCDEQRETFPTWRLCCLWLAAPVSTRGLISHAAFLPYCTLSTFCRGATPHYEPEKEKKKQGSVSNHLH